MDDAKISEDDDVKVGLAEDRVFLMVKQPVSWLSRERARSIGLLLVAFAEQGREADEI